MTNSNKNTNNTITCHSIKSLMDKPHINTQQNLADKLQVTQPHISNRMKECNLRFPKVMPGNSFAEKNPRLIDKWHPKNCLTPYQVTYSTNKKYWFLEPKTEEHPWSDHEWCGIPKDLTDKCAVCEGKHVVYSNSLKGVAEKEWDTKTKKWTVNDNARIALKEWDYDKNNPPEQVIAYSNKEFYFICTKNKLHTVLY